MSNTSVPYASATSGERAKEQTVRILRQFGCKGVGFMDNFEEHSTQLIFYWRNREVSMKVSAQGWASMFLRQNPWNHRRHVGEQLWKERALAQGEIAMYSVLRDWVKAQITAMESGVMDFETAFLPHMLTRDGRTVRELIGGDDTLFLPTPAGDEA